MFNALPNELGVPNKIIKQLFGIYENVFGKVCLNGRVFDRFNVPLGVKYWCNASPELFGLYIDCLAKFIDREYGNLDPEF